MRTTSILSRNLLSRIATVVATGSLLLAASSCGGSAATSMTAPTQIVRCGIAMQTVDAPLPAEGGTASIAVTAARECAWSASAEGAWLTIRSGASGQGDGAVEFVAAVNPDPQMRRGSIIANGQRTEVSQAAGTCEIVLGQSAASFGQAGGSGQLQVRASSSMCAWSAATTADWIQLRTTSGQGNGALSFDVPASTAPPRSATITVAGQTFSVTQSEGCTYAISPASQSVPSSGGGGAIAITTAPACPWTAATNASWLTVTPAAGRGPSPVTFSVAATSGRSRSGTAIVAGETFTVAQSQGCAYVVQPATGQVGSSGGTVSFNVTANRECDWSAASNDSWITLQGLSSGSGEGTVRLSVAATTGPGRSGSVTIAGQRIAITQSPGCSFSITPESATAPSAASTGKVTVSAGSGCAWTASSNAPWLTIASGSAGSGSGEVQYAAAATAGPARSGTITVAGRTFTLNQGEGCAFTLSPTFTTIDDDGGQGSFAVQAGSGCGWSATSTVPWVTISSGASGTGDGTVRFTAGRNTGPSRSGAITAAGKTFTVSQGNGCSIALASPTFNAPAAGGSGAVGVTAGSGCSWTATSNANWLSITSGAAGTGNGTVGFTAAANNGPLRSDTLTIGGRTFTVSQAENCSLTIAPERVTMAAAAGDTNVAVTTVSGCPWSSSSSTPWISVAAGSSGSGSGTVKLTVQVNSGAARSGSATIAGRTFTIDQNSGCAFAITPTSQTMAASGGSLPVTVTSPGGCTWTASSQAPWLSVTSGASGSGGGTVQVEVQANTGAQRLGTATIAGQTFTVMQDGGCSYVVSPESLTAGAAGGPARVDISTGSSCGWSAVNAVGWIAVSGAAAGSGSGGVDLSIAPNAGPARSGTIAVAGRTVTVTQDSGCTFSLSATSQTMGASGGAGSVSVTAGTGCAWTAVSAAPWLVITDGASGSGPGAVQFIVEANATGAPRSGTLNIANVAFTLTQQ
jgi:hypothetical protein